MKLYLEKIKTGEAFSRAEATTCFDQLFNPLTTEDQIAEFLILLKDRELEPLELVGFHDYLFAHSKNCNLDCDTLFDVCGTGGDGKNTINVSTLTAFTLAAMGEKVAKHGNYSASSSFGSSNLLEALSVPLVDNEEQARQIFDSVGIVFLHAPFWHPKLKQVAKVRKSLGFRTLFNILGPLLNPTAPMYQIVGTPSMSTATLIAQVLRTKLADSKREFAVLTDMNGYDEVSLTTSAKIFYKSKQEDIHPENYGCKSIDADRLLLPTDVSQAPSVSKRFLSGLGEVEHESVVAANTALALQLRYPDRALEDMYQSALSTIRSGKGMQILNALRNFA